jgi:polyisoprenoid-binding protein YceI
MRYLLPGAAAALSLTVLTAAYAADAPSAAHYSLDAAKSSLQFTFVQAGAQNTGRFKHFTVSFDPPPKGSTAGSLEVTVDLGSLDTGDSDRDDTLRDKDLFDVAQFPQAHFSAVQIATTASGYEAAGKLTIRGVTRDVRIPLTFRAVTENGAAAGYLSGKTVVRRLDYGVGQGDWKATDQAGNDVTVSWSLRLTASAR